MMKEKKIFQPLTSEDICEIYNLLHSNGEVAFFATKKSLSSIEAIVANVSGVNYGKENYDQITEKVVAYLYFLIKNHPFVDGNKRTAVLVFLVLCITNNLERDDKYELDSLAVFIESIDNPDHQQVIKIIASNIFKD